MFRARVLELFAGGGGAHIGIAAAGCETVACVERDALACETLGRNGAHVYQMDVHEFAAKHIAAFRGSIDGIWASVPCQPYSRAGERKGAEDDRDCWPITLDIVRSVLPAFVIIENVIGCPAEMWARDLRALGYPNVAIWQLTACDFGVPQRRERIFVVASFGPLCKPEPTGFRTVADVLPHLRGAWIRTQGFDRGNRNRALAKSCDTDCAPTLACTNNLYVWNRDVGNTRYLNPCDYGARIVTLSEYKALQGFPREWEFAGDKAKQYRQIGNAVPPALASAVVRAALHSR